MKLLESAHKRFNLLNGEWVLVSPHRMNRPWNGKQEDTYNNSSPSYDKNCYLCPGNTRASGDINPKYEMPYSFINDFSALLPNNQTAQDFDEDDILKAAPVNGLCKVICFSPRHDLSLPRMKIEEIVLLIRLWKKEFEEISQIKWIKNILIFENKGEIMGCSNPHPHGQIWAQSDLPDDIMKETAEQKKYLEKNGRLLLSDYLEMELKKDERVVCSNEHFVVLVPFWATWPFETIVLCRSPKESILEFTENEILAFADIISRLTIRYDNLFQVSFPYSAGMHQSPVNDNKHPEWQWHMHFYPPLLRSASIKKFMVGYELLAGPQRDITPEYAAQKLKEQSEIYPN